MKCLKLFRLHHEGRKRSNSVWGQCVSEVYWTTYDWTERGGV